MLTNKIINKIFADAGIKNHRLLNKHYSKYTEVDLQVLEKIKNGEQVKNQYYVQKGEKGKKVIRVSDGQMFDSVGHCSEVTGLTIAKIYAYLHHKNPEYKLFKYL